MQSEESVETTYRFYTILYDLINKKALRGVQTFCNQYGINRRNLINAETNPSREIKIEWLSFLVRDYGVSGNWLLTGKGKRYGKEPKPKIFRNTKKIIAD